MKKMMMRWGGHGIKKACGRNPTEKLLNSIMVGKDGTPHKYIYIYIFLNLFD